MKSRLEYSEHSGTFHYHKVNHQGINENNYVMLAFEIEEELGNKFIKTMEKVYPKIGAFENPKHIPPYPKNSTIKRHFDIFKLYFDL